MHYPNAHFWLPHLSWLHVADHKHGAQHTQSYCAACNGHIGSGFQAHLLPGPALPSVPAPPMPMPPPVPPLTPVPCTPLPWPVDVPRPAPVPARRSKRGAAHHQIQRVRAVGCMAAARESTHSPDTDSVLQVAASQTLPGEQCMAHLPRLPSQHAGPTSIVTCLMLHHTSHQIRRVPIRALPELPRPAT
jgi:hypothetical protein